jgi:osmotically-inducible protein OsmY
MTQNEDLKKNVEEALLWEPLLHATDIRVAVTDGIVTLSGTVDRFPKKFEAERVVKTLHGVKGIVEKIEVCHPEEWTALDDAVIANNAVKSLEWNWKLPKNCIRITVENGWVTLDGMVQWYHEKEEAMRTLLNLDGVAGISNQLAVHSPLADSIEKRTIQRQLQKSWALHTCDILVEVNGPLVILIGAVHSIYQKEEASRIAWKTPGVDHIENKLIIKNTVQYAL